MLVKPFSTAPGPWKGCNSPCSDVLLCVVIQVEDSVENLLNSDMKNNKKSTVIKLGMSIVNVIISVVSKILHG